MSPRRSLPLVVAACAALALGPGAVRAAAAGTPVLDVASVTSSNWAGYAVSAPSGSSFTSVSGSWVQPAATCTPGASSYSAFWLGLGGFADGSQALEQIGSEVDCTQSGSPRYSVWYELVPAPVVPVSLTVAPGDTLTASVTVSGTSVTLAIADTTTGASFSKTIALDSIDTSSAEWIAEAPSTCGRGDCRPLPLADFGSVSFTAASATAGGRAGTISDPAWSATAVTLQGVDAGRSYRSRFTPPQAAADALPGALSSDGSGFSVTWQAQGAASSPASPGPASRHRWGWD